MNICKLSSLNDLPTLPSLYKLSLNDNSLTTIEGLSKKCPALLELSLSGNAKITTIDQLNEIAKFSSIMRLELEGCAITKQTSYREKIFKLSDSLEVIDGFNKQGEEVPDDDEEDDEEDDEAERIWLTSHFICFSMKIVLRC